MATVALVGTFDTKGREYAFLRDRLVDHGVAPLLVDVGVFEPVAVEPDIPRREVAQAAGSDVGALAAAGDRGQAVEAMARGARAVVSALFAAGRIQGVLGLGGSGGSAIATAAMPRATRRRPQAHGLDVRLRGHAPVRGRG